MKNKSSDNTQRPSRRPTKFRAKNFWLWMRRRSAWDWLAVGAFIWILATRVPSWLEAWQFEGEAAPLVTLTDLKGQAAPFPPVFGKWVAVFWTTWCGPCKVELDRLRDAAENGEIDPTRVLAVSVGEDAKTVKEAARERNYKFTILLDEQGRLASRLKVAVTPTVLFLEPDNQISWMTSGLSPTLVWRSKRHLAP